MSDINVDKTLSEAERKAKQLPDPSGFKLLCMVPKVEEEFGNSGIIKSTESVRVEEQTTIVLFVAKVGPDAYKDPVRFPSGPWCKVGDFVVVRAYSGTRIKIHGTEWRIINDDSVDGTVEDPRGIGRAG
jgi:co-chaperonin GroES (HSP10)